jgi:gluconolactonase
MALDRAGNLYVAHFGAGVVRVFDPQGRLLGTLGSGASSITNLAFGGAAMNELYLYAANGNSLAEFTQGGRIVRLTLPGVEGISPIGVSAR